MTKEELKQEAEEYAMNKANYGDKCGFVRNPITVVKEAYLAGAEPREKRIADLEKENAELKEKFNAGNISFEDWLIYCKEQGLNLATQEMEQEEIDEMLKDCWIASRYNSDATYLCLKQSVQLTKAKEIINKLLSRLNRLTYTGLDCEECKQAEQFINGEGCPDCFCKDCTKEDCGIKKLGLVEVEK